MLKKTSLGLFLLPIALTLLFSCSAKNRSTSTKTNDYRQIQATLTTIIAEQNLTQESRFTVINQLANTMLAAKDYSALALFLSNYVERHPDDMYSAWWLLMTGFAHLQNKALPVAEYYFDRIINNYSDLIVKNTSVHFIALQNLIQISTSSNSRIYYFNQLISRFPDKINPTELYVRLAMEYENTGEWEQSLKAYSKFLAQPDATTIQIAGIPDAYSKARKLLDYNSSTKDWTFESLDALEGAVKDALVNYDYRRLDRYKSKVNFFAMSWKQEEQDENSQTTFSIQNFVSNKIIRFNEKLDEASNPNEAFLRTWGWNRISVWYLYFRKVNFPANPEIHGRWEWAGIYYGDKV